MEQKPSLPVHEWLAITFIIFIVLSLALLSLRPSEQLMLPPQQSLEHDRLEITIDGAVKHPGTYQVQQGSLLQEVISQAELSPDADLKRLKLDKKLVKDQVVTVPRLKLLRIYIAGAVDNPGIIAMPKGSRMEDLVKHIQFQPDADIEKLPKKRRLKDGEIVTIKRTKGT